MRENVNKQVFSNVGELESILDGMDDYEVLPGSFTTRNTRRESLVRSGS